MKTFITFCAIVSLATSLAAAPAKLPLGMVPAPPEALPLRAKVVALEVSSAQVRLQGCYDAVQLIVTARLSTGDRMDVTRLAQIEGDGKIAAVSATGHVTPLGGGTTHLTVKLAGKSASVPCEVVAFDPAQKVDFIRDVNPVIAQLGCSTGTCHGAKDGKAGFKLSLRGYDPIFDVRSLVDDHAGRRVNFASPDDSLMLLKATGAVPHESGQRTPYDSNYYRILRAWIARRREARTEDTARRSHRSLAAESRPADGRIGPADADHRNLR